MTPEYKCGVEKYRHMMIAEDPNCRPWIRKVNYCLLKEGNLVSQENLSLKIAEQKYQYIMKFVISGESISKQSIGKCMEITNATLRLRRKKLPLLTS